MTGAGMSDDDEDEGDNAPEDPPTDSEEEKAKSVRYAQIYFFSCKLIPI